jgi:hypothetical protein
MGKENPKTRWKMQRGRDCRGIEKGWEVLNGNKQGDEDGEWTYIGNRGETTIAYGIVNEKV